MKTPTDNTQSNPDQKKEHPFFEIFGAKPSNRKVGQTFVTSVNVPNYLDRLKAKWSNDRVGQTFVTSFKKPKPPTENSKPEELPQPNTEDSQKVIENTTHQSEQDSKGKKDDQNDPADPSQQTLLRQKTIDELLIASGARYVQKTGAILMPLSKEQRESMTNSNPTMTKEDLKKMSPDESANQASEPQEYPLTPKDYLAIHKIELTDQGFININNRLSEEAFARFEEDIESFIKFEQQEQTLIEKIKSLPLELQKKVRRYAYQKAFKMKLHDLN